MGSTQSSAGQQRNTSPETINSDQGSQVETPQHEVNENYFERANASFRMALLKGEYQEGETIDSIAENDKASLFDKIVDAIKSPKAAITWVGTWLMETLGGSWFGEITGITKKLQEKKDEILAAGNSAYAMAQKASNGIKSNANFANLDFSDPIKLARSINILDQSPQNQFALDIAKTEFHLKRNPQISANMQSKGTKEEWIAIFTAAGTSTENHDRLFQLMTGQKELDQILKEFPETENSKITATGLAATLTGAAASKIDQLKSHNVDYTSDKYQERLNKHNKAIKGTTLNQSYKENGGPYEISFSDPENPTIEAQYHVDNSLRLPLHEIGLKGEEIWQQNKSSLTALLAASTVLYPISAGISGMTNNLTDLAKLPFSLGGIPLITVLAASTGLYLYTKDNPQMPYDLEKAQDNILEKFKTEDSVGYEQLKNKYPDIDNKFKAALKMLSQAKLPELDLNIQERLGQFADETTLTPESLIQKRNNNGLSMLITELEQRKVAAMRSGSNMTLLNTQIETLKKFNNQKLTPEIVQNIQNLFPSEQEEFKLNLVNGLYFLNITDKETQETTPIPLFIDPSLSIDEQLEIAKKYKIFNKYDIIGGSALDSLVTEGRLQLGKVVNGEGILAKIGNSAVVIAEGGMQYFLGPWEIIGKLTDVFDKDSEVTMEDVGIAYAGSVATATFFTVGRDVAKTILSAKSGFVNHLGLRTIGNALYLPVKLPLTLPVTVFKNTFLTLDAWSTTGRTKMYAELQKKLLDNTASRGVARISTNHAYTISRIRRVEDFMQAHIALRRTTHDFGVSWHKDPTKIVDEKTLESLYKKLDKIVNLKDLSAATRFEEIITKISSKTATFQDLKDLQKVPQWKSQVDEIVNKGVINSELDPRKFKIDMKELEAAKKFRYENAGKKSIGSMAGDLLEKAGKISKTQLGKVFRMPRFTKKGIGGAIAVGVAGGYAVDKFVLDKRKADNNVNIENTTELLSNVNLDETSKTELQTLQNDQLIQLSENTVFADLTKLEQTYMSGDLKTFNNQSILAKTSTPEINVDDFAEHSFPSYVEKVKEYAKNNKPALVQLLKTLKENDAQKLKGLDQFKFLPFTEKALSTGSLQLCTGFLTLELDGDNIKVKTSSEEFIKNTLYGKVDLNETLQDSNPKLLKQMDEIYDGTAVKLNEIFANQEASDEEKAAQLTAIVQEYAVNLAKLKDDLTTLTNADTVKQLILDFLPLTGTYQDAKRVGKSIERGNWGQAGINGLSYLFSSLVDTSTFLTAGLTTPAAIAARAAKTAENMKTLLLRVTPAIDKIITSIKANATATKITKVLTFLPKKAGQLATSPFTLLMGLDLYRVSDSNQETIETI